MLRLYYTRFAENTHLPDCLICSEYRAKRLERISNTILKKQNAVAELLLNYAARKFSGEFKLPLEIMPTKGRPELRGGEFFFSISHSEDIVACVISDNNIGLDVQIEKEYKPALAERFYSNNEIELLSDSIDKTDTFFRIWTMKESYVKALGKGISHGFTSFSVGMDNMVLCGGGASFWHEKRDNCHFALCTLQDSAFTPEVFEYIEIKELL